MFFFFFILSFELTPFGNVERFGEIFLSFRAVVFVSDVIMCTTLFEKFCGAFGIRGEHTNTAYIRVFAEYLVGLIFLVVRFLYIINPNHEILFAVGKSGPSASFNLLFLALGWPWVGEFVGFHNNVFIKS